jgi:hypothetical protein
MVNTSKSMPDAADVTIPKNKTNFGKNCHNALYF